MGSGFESQGAHYRREQVDFVAGVGHKRTSVRQALRAISAFIALAREHGILAPDGNRCVGDEDRNGRSRRRVGLRRRLELLLGQP